MSASRRDPRRKKAREMLLAGEKVKDIAEKLGVSIPAIYLWRRQDGFAARMDAEHESRLRIISDEIKSTLPDVWHVLYEIATNTTARDSDRIRAVVEILDRAGLSAPPKIVGGPITRDGVTQQVHGPMTRDDARALVELIRKVHPDALGEDQ